MICVARDAQYKREVKLAENPLGSLPVQMKTWKESKALYRLLEEPDVTFEALMQPHLQQTQEQASSFPITLLVQDTTDIDLSHRHKMSGVGQIGNERGRGFFVQTVLAVHPQTREVFGCIAQEPFVRIPAPQGEQRSGRHKRDERETDVWMRQVHAIGTPAQGTIWVHVGDRGADMFPFFQACQSTQTHFLVRVAQNRRMREGEEEIGYSLTQARSWTSQASRPFEVPGSHGHQERSTQVQLAFGPMTLLPPRNESRAGKDPMTVWIIRERARENTRGRTTLGMDFADLVAYHHARTSEGARGVVSTSLVGRRLSPMSQKWMSHRGAAIANGRWSDTPVGDFVASGGAFVAASCLCSPNTRPPSECGD